MSEQHNELLEAVDQLTKDRTINTWQLADEYLETDEIHKEVHPPLLVMLLEGTGVTSGGRSSDPGIPIDADALEMWGQVRDLIRLWCRQTKALFDQDDLLGSIRRWYIRHENLHRAGIVGEATNLDVTRMVQGWVRMIEAKFDPPEKREWKDACPNWVDVYRDGAKVGERRCAARRVTVGGEERFAITLNVTTLVAECCVCHEKWVGQMGLSMLRYNTNIWNLEKADEEAARIAHLEELAAGVNTQRNSVA